MEDLKRFIIPTIAAIALHGFLVSVKLPKHDSTKPMLMGNPIQIEINAYSPKTIAPKKNEADKPTEAAPPVTAVQKVVQKSQVPAPPQPIAVAKRPQKIVKPVQTKKTAVTPDKNKVTAPQQSRLENRMQDKPVSLPTAVAQTVKSNKTAQDQSQKSNSPVPIKQTAIPMYRQNQQPPYPVMAKRRGYEGEILLNVLVNAKGMVSDIKIKQSSGHRSLDTAALTTVKNWLFTPATEGGRPVSMWVNVPIEFRLESNDKS